MLYYAKQAATAILVHTPASLEEPADAPPKKSAPVGGTGLFGKKLRAAVDKLETARQIGQNQDAMFLLAQMNFVGHCLVWLGWVSWLTVYSTEIGRIPEIIPLRSRGTKSWQICLEILRRKVWLGSCMLLASRELYRGTKQRYCQGNSYPYPRCCHQVFDIDRM